MKKIYSLALLLCLLLSFSKPASADHLVGSDISYTCTSTPGQFLITLVLYRDCDGIELCYGGCGAACSRTMSIKGADASCNTSSFGSITLSLVSVRDVDRKESCPNSKNICSNMGCATAGSFTPGVERYEFQGYANIGATSGIPASCCNVRFVYEECCRSARISTGATWQNFYVDAVINRCHSVSPCNSSPQFTNEPYDIVCGGESVVYNNGTIEPDRDSLTFAFTPALQGFGSSVTYDPPFAYNKPMPWIGNAAGVFPAGIRCDPQTGDIMFTPGNNSGSNFYGIIAIEVKQWKTVSGVPTVIGTTRRDIQMVVSASCVPNNPPILTTIPADTGISGLNPKLNWEVCEGSQLCFDVVSRDKDTLSAAIWDTTYLQWDAALAPLGATFTRNYVDSTRPREDSYKFCWTPTIGTASNAPYFVVVKNNDSKCPIPGRNSRGFSIKVNRLPSATITKTKQGCDKYKVAYSSPNTVLDSTKLIISKAPYNYSYTAGADTFVNLTTTPSLSLNTPGNYLIQLILSSKGCTQTLYDTLMVDSVVQAVAMNDTLVCKGNSITLNAIAKYGTPTYIYRWYNSIKDTALPPLNAPVFTSSNLTVTPTASKTYTIQVRDAGGCRSYDSVFVSVNKGLKNTVVTNVQCNGLNNGSIVMNMLDTLMPFQYRINSGTFQSSKQFTGLAPGMYTVESKDSNNCSISASGLTIAQPEVLRDTLTRVVNNQTCKGINNGQLTTTAKGGNAPYRFSLDSIVFKSNGLFTNLAPATYKVHILDTQNCYTSITLTITPADSLYYQSSSQNITCYGKSNGEIQVTGIGGKAPYTYRLGISGAFVSDSVFKNLMPNTYVVNVRDQNFCVTTFNQTITSPTRMVTTNNVTGASCFGTIDGTAILHTTGGVKPYQFREATNGALSTDSVFTNLAAGPRKFYTVDNNACIDSVTVTINQPLQTLATVVKEDPSCFQKTDGSITVNITQGKAPYQYALDAGAFGTAHVFNNLDDRLYTITVKDSSGCLATFNTTLVDPPLIAAGSITGAITSLQNNTEIYSVTAQAGLSYMWGVQKGSILSGQNTSAVNVRWDSIGTGQVGVIVYSDSTCGDTATLTVNIGVNGLSESARLFGLEVFPNPTSGLLNITLKTLPQNHSLKLYDIHGRLIVEQDLKLTQQLNLENLSQGVYLLEVGDLPRQMIIH